MPSAARTLAISGRLTLDMHSLNNEGAEGNQLLTRMVHVVGDDGEPVSVNAISGDMLKHVFAEHLQAEAKETGLPLCAGCAVLNANRVNLEIERNPDFFAEKGLQKAEKQAVKILDAILPHCAVDDVAGVLITQGDRSVPRKSAVEFGWVIGLPDRTRTEQYFHVKYDADRGAGAGGAEGANTGQNIFYRPASSGIYACVSRVELERIGRNDITKKRPAALSEDEVRRRQRAALRALAYTFLQLNGAHRNTQLPHAVRWEGCVSVSRSTSPAPLLSPMDEGYRDGMDALAEQFNRAHPGTVTVRRFATPAEFATILEDLSAELAG